MLEKDKKSKRRYYRVCRKYWKVTTPHLHYEVIKDGIAINPINFYSGDLTPAEFEAMLEVASIENQSLD